MHSCELLQCDADEEHQIDEKVLDSEIHDALHGRGHWWREGHVGWMLNNEHRHYDSCEATIESQQCNITDNRHKDVHALLFEGENNVTLRCTLLAFTRKAQRNH